jgi:hypothetical protein
MRAAALVVAHFICEVRRIAAVNVMTLTRELRASVEPIAGEVTP